MELRQLRYFVVLANRLNFSQAASDLYITQGTLSQQIRQLEGELGVDLFERSSHSVHLTESGAELLSYAKRTLDSARECTQRVADLKRGLTGTLNIGATHSFARLIRDTIRDFVKKYPGVKINIIYTTAKDLLELLHNRRIDFFISFKSAVEYADLEMVPLFQSRLCAVMSSSHPLTEKTPIRVSATGLSVGSVSTPSYLTGGRLPGTADGLPGPSFFSGSASNSKKLEPALTFDDLKPYPIALLASGMQSRKAFERFVDLDTSGLDVKLEMNDPNLMLDILAATNFVSITSSLAINYHPGLVALPLEGIERDMLGCIHRLRGTYVKRSSEVFTKLLLDSAFLASLG